MPNDPQPSPSLGAALRLPTSPKSDTAFVFTSSRAHYQSGFAPHSSSDVNIGRPVLHAGPSTLAHTKQTQREHRTRPTLSEDQLLRHGRGAMDVRTSLLYARTPAGFIPFPDSIPPTPLLGPPPVYDPNENPFFPPVVLMHGGLGTSSPAATGSSPHSSASPTKTDSGRSGSSGSRAASEEPSAFSSRSSVSLSSATSSSKSGSSPDSSFTFSRPSPARQGQPLSLTELFTGELTGLGNPHPPLPPEKEGRRSKDGSTSTRSDIHVKGLKRVEKEGRKDADKKKDKERKRDKEGKRAEREGKIPSLREKDPEGRKGRREKEKESWKDREGWTDAGDLRKPSPDVLPKATSDASKHRSDRRHSRRKDISASKLFDDTSIHNHSTKLGAD